MTLDIIGKVMADAVTSNAAIEMAMLTWTWWPDFVVVCKLFLTGVC